MFSALSAMHDLGLIHRDISPENLMLEQGTVRLLDFGCARESANGDATMTIMLRHGYAPLEQYQSSSEGQGPWTDIYALSATIYYCITGKKPPQAMDRLLEDKLTPPRKLGVDLSERQEKALLKGLSVLPRTRFQSVEEFHTALYEGFSPEPVPPVPEPEPEPKPEPVPEPEPEPAPEPEPEPTRENKLPVWLKAHKKAVGIGAAALLAAVILIAAIAAGMSRTDPGLDGPDSSDPASTGTGVTNQPVGSENVPAPAYVYDWDLDRFEELMNDSSVSVIIIPDGQGIRIDRPMEITKPIQMEVSTQLHINADVTLSATLSVPQGTDVFNSGILTISGEGRIELDGYLENGFLVRTVDGGSIHVGGTGYAALFNLWLEQSGDLEGSGKVDIDRNFYIVADEDALLEKAVHVSTFAELYNAVDDRRTEAIAIDGSFAMEYWLTVNTPVLISEGAVLTAGDNAELRFEALVINRGRMELADVQLGNGGAFVNYGGFDAALGAESGSCVLNLGEHRTWGGDLASTVLNAGSMTVERDGRELTLRLLDCCFLNNGSIDVVSGAMELCQNRRFDNNGTIRVAADASLINNGVFYNGAGQLILEGDLWNDIGLLILPSLDGVEFRGGHVEGGMIDSWSWEDAAQPLVNDGSIRNAAIVSRRYPWEEDVNVTEVQSAEVLRSKAEYSTSQKLILWVTGDVVVEGDLTIMGHNLVVDGRLEVTGRLTVDGGTVQNNNILAAGHLELQNGAYLRNDASVDVGALTLRDSTADFMGSIDLDGGRLELYNARACAQDWLSNTGGIGVYDGSYLYCNGYSEQGDMDIEVRDSTFVTPDLHVGENGGGSVTVGSGGRLLVTAYMNLYNNSAVTVENGGELDAWIYDIHQDSGAKLVNDGFVAFSPIIWDGLNLDGETVNRGHVSMYGEIWINGAFRNEGEVDLIWGMLYAYGEFNNRGTVFTHSGDGTGFQGNWIGEGIEYR